MNIAGKLSLSIAMAAILGAGSMAYATEGAQEVTPCSGVLKPEDVGLKARTNFKFLIPTGGYAGLNAEIKANPTPSGISPYKGSAAPYETPASLAAFKAGRDELGYCGFRRRSQFERELLRIIHRRTHHHL